MACYFVGHRALAYERDASLYRCSDRIFAYQALYVILRPCMRRSVICEAVTLCCDRYFLRVDRQRSVFCRDNISFCYIFVPVHDGVAFRDRVVAFGCVCYVRHAACCCCHQLVAIIQGAFCKRYFCILVGFAVICPFIACRRDYDLNRCF